VPWRSRLQNGGPAGAGIRQSGVAATYGKTITERLGIVVEENWTRLDRVAQHPSSGWQNLDTEIKYLAVIDQPREFLLTLGLGREFGGTGAQRVGATPGSTDLAENHARMIERYRAQEWAEARAALGQCRSRDPRLEALCDVYDERLAYFTDNPPAPDWDGVFVALTK